MKTEVQRFCELFSRELSPFGYRLNRAIGSLSSQLGHIDLACLDRIRSNLRDVEHRYSSLLEKIDNQQAYLLIFGPLKSGKSTLMNAIAGTYVSEVSSLPAYPALVYVKNADHSRYLATDYNGETREFSDSIEMCDTVQQEHERLARTILDVENSGEEFDPAQHYPRAIRRLNVEVPARALAESGTVLIDTPGLYSRMKFGYDQMTREFRNTAACAIFVVKTDNLFFEKVFEEFEDLLGSFSRIFLVSNIDNSKQDLQPDGSRRASLESSDPRQVIEAFKSLSMSATLRKAIDEKRLNIYPIDLLNAASRRLAGTTAEDVDSSDATFQELDLLADLTRNAGIATDNEMTLPAEADAGESSYDDGFDCFLEDLTSYLNSNEYIQDFMADSLQMARELGQCAVEIATSDAAGELLDSCKELRNGIDRKQKQLEAIEKLEEIDWSASFRHLDEEKERLLGMLSQGHSRLIAALEAGLAEWMQTDDSWNDLLTWHLKNILEQEVRRDSDSILQYFRNLLDGYSGGARLNMFQMGRLHQAGLRIEDSVPQLLSGFGHGVTVGLPRLNLDLDEVPLKRSLVDMVLFRKKAKVREKFFGVEGDLEIPGRKKRKRLAGGGEESLKEQLQELVRNQLPALQRQYIDQILEDYREHFTTTLWRKTVDLRISVNREISGYRDELKARMQAVGILEGTRASAQKLAASLGSIQTEFDLRLTSEVTPIAWPGDVHENGEQIPGTEAAIGFDQPVDSGKSATEPDDQGYPPLKSNIAGI